MTDSRNLSRLDAFAEELSKHDAERGDPGGSLKVVAERMGITYEYANALLQRLRKRMGDRAI